MSATLLPHASDARPQLGRLYVFGLLLLLAGCCLLPADTLLSRVFYGGGIGEHRADPSFHIPGDLRRVVSLCEIFGHGTGVVLIVLTVLVLDPNHRRTTLRIAGAAFGAGLVATLLKFLIFRTRPLASDLAASPWETFGGWLPSSEIEHAFRSSPSGHSTQAAALAVLLAWRYPRGKYLFAAFAGLAMLQRVTSGAHFASDALWGAGIGVLFAGFCLEPQLLGGVFDHFEGRRRRHEDSEELEALETQPLAPPTKAPAKPPAESPAAPSRAA